MTRLANIFVGFLVLAGCNASGNADVGTVTGGVTGATTGTGTGTTTGATTGATTGTTTGATTGSATGSGCVELLGCGTHVTDDLLVETFVGPGEGLTLPRDLEFHPQQTDELWIVNRTDHSVVIVFDAGLGSQSTQKLVDGENQRHFLAQPSAMAFNQDNGTWASIHEEDDYTQGPPPWGTPQDFMGPTHWTGDSAIFAGDHWTHLDMLHNSPLGMGIAWDNESVFWVFDGYHSSLTRYNFKSDHGLGGTDHSDGVVHRFVEGEVSMVRDVPSHLFVDHATGLVYVADTGNNRIKVLTKLGVLVRIPFSPGFAHLRWWAEGVRNAAVGAGPTGRLYVTDAENNEIKVLTKNASAA